MYFDTVFIFCCCNLGSIILLEVFLLYFFRNLTPNVKNISGQIMGVEGMPNFNPILRSTKPIASQYQAVNRAAYARKNSPLQTLKNLFGSLPCVLSFTCHIYPKISEMFQKTFSIWGLKIRNSRLFLPQNFFSDCRVG